MLDLISSPSLDGSTAPNLNFKDSYKFSSSDPSPSVFSKLTEDQRIQELIKLYHKLNSSNIYSWEVTTSIDYQWAAWVFRKIGDKDYSVLNKNFMLNSIWSYKGELGLNIISRFTTGFRVRVKRDFKTDENRLHCYRQEQKRSRVILNENIKFLILINSYKQNRNLNKIF